MRQQLIDTARTYTGDGISITLTDDRKVSVGSWKDFQSRLITDKEIIERANKASGIAIICGSISGGLEVVDIDLKYDITGTLYNRLLTAIPDAIASKLVIARTKSGGAHLYYRCSSVMPNTKLARRPVTPQEQKENPHLKVMVLIETRGEGGYIVAPPTPGYSWENGDHNHIETLSIEERDELFEICRTFNEYLEEPDRIERVGISLSPIDDYNQRGDILSLLTSHGWKVERTTTERIYFTRPGKTHGVSGDLLLEKRWFSVFTTSCQFEPNKAYSPAAVFCMLECDNDWKKTAKRLSSDGYGMNEREAKRQNKMFSFIRQKYEDGLTDEQVSREVQKAYDFTRDEATGLITSFQDHEKIESGKFWMRNKNEQIVLIETKLLNVLSDMGFRMMPYDPAENDCRLVRVDNNIIEESSTEKIKKATFEHIRNIAVDEAEEVANIILKKHNLFNDSFLEFLPRLIPNFLEDTKDAAYFTFENKIIKVTKDEVIEESYGNIGKHIWKSHKDSFNIELHDPNSLETRISGPYSDVFPRFLYLISGQDMDRFLAVCTIIGYLIHKYKDPAIPVAIILAEETDNDAKGGGTGKGIFATAVGKMIQAETIDGKNFKLDKSFAFQRIGLDTKLIIVQDVRAKVDFEGYYSMLTEGITVEKKGQPEVFIPFKRSPKFIFTTNYSIPDTGNHAQRRQRVVPFSDYFSPTYTPMDEFKEQLFEDWDRGKWLAFYNFMFDCCGYYLKHGLVNIPVTDSMRLKSLKTAYGNEFKDWFDKYRQSDCHQWRQFGELYKEFISNYEMSETEYSRKKFRGSISQGCQAFGYRLETTNRGPAGGVMYRIIKAEESLNSSQNTAELSKGLEFETETAS